GELLGEPGRGAGPEMELSPGRGFPGRSLHPASTRGVHPVGAAVRRPAAPRRRVYREAMGRLTARRPVVRLAAERAATRRPDALAVEEPLELRVDGRALSVTMRTPGNDVELAHGFLLTEGVIGDPADVATARYCDSVDDSGRNTYNVLDVALAPGVAPPDVGVERNFYTTSSCGVCGKAALDAV